MVAWLGPAISAAGNLIGGIIGNSASDDASDFAAKQFRFQNLAAKKSIQWRVKDAREAGIHPIYALGAQAFSPSPVSISGSAPLADGIAAMGQDIGRAVTAGQSAHLNAAENSLKVWRSSVLDWKTSSLLVKLLRWKSPRR